MDCQPTKAQKARTRQRERTREIVLREITDELRAEVRAEVLEEVCAERNRVFGRKPLKEHEFVPVRGKDSHLSERCVVCRQRREAVLPLDYKARVYYVEHVMDEVQFEERARTNTRQHNSEDQSLLGQGWLGATGPVGATGAAGRFGVPGPFHSNPVPGNVHVGPPGSSLQQMSLMGQLASAVIPQVDALSVQAKNLGEAMKAVQDHQAINGQRPSFLILDENTYDTLAAQGKGRMTSLGKSFPSDGLDQLLGIPVVKGDVSGFLNGVATD